MAKMMFLIVKRQWRQHHDCFTGLFAVCGHKANYLQDQVDPTPLLLPYPELTLAPHPRL